VKRLRTLVILAVIAAIVGGAVGLSTSFLGGNDNVAEAASLYIAPANAIGPDAFSPSFATGQLPAEYTFEFQSGQIPASSESLYIQPRGTYGGPGSNVCDIEGMKEFFRSHPDRAAAWARIQGIDFADIDAFLDGLQPAFLAQNVKLTMYGFKNGQEYGYEAIIKAGTAVLVDELGLPRARCACGNPLVTDQPPTEETTTTTTTTTEVPVEIEECPEGTTYYRTEDGLPQSFEPMVDEWVEIQPDNGGFNPSSLDDFPDDDIERWEPTYDLCAPPCPEYQPNEGEVYDDSWRFEDGQWVSLFGDRTETISDTRLLPGWTDDCGVCPPPPAGNEDVAPDSRRYGDEFATWDPEMEQWVDTDGNPVELPDEAAALNDPVNLDVDEIGPELEQSLEDEFNNDYDPCAPVCPLDEYLSSLPTWFTDPAGFAWNYDNGMWVPSNGGPAQAEPPAWIADRLASFAAAYDPNGPCGMPRTCPPITGEMAARYVVDANGILWTNAGGTWYSPTGDTRTSAPEFPGCSPCPAESASGVIVQFIGTDGIRWMRNAQGQWFNLSDDRLLADVAEVPGYLEHCGSTACPEGTPRVDELYTDPQGRIWRWDGEVWINVEDGTVQAFSPDMPLPGCGDEQAAANSPVTAAIACTYNPDAGKHQMRLVTEGLTSQIIGVFDSIPPNTRYTRVGNLFYRILDEQPVGNVEVRIVMSDGTTVSYFHEVADCMQPAPRAGAFGIEFLWTCGRNPNTLLWEARGLALDRGTSPDEIVSVTHRASSDRLVRRGDTFIQEFTTNPAGAFYVVVELTDGAFNELLVDVGGCDQVLDRTWSRMSAQVTCNWDPAVQMNVLTAELTGANQDVMQVWDLTTMQQWNRTPLSGDNTWYWLTDPTPGLIGQQTLAVRMWDDFVYSFTFTPRIDINNRCSDGPLVPGDDFGAPMAFACGINGNGKFELQVLPDYDDDFPDGTIDEVRDSIDPVRFYQWMLGGYRAEWASPPAGEFWVTVTLIDGRYNQYRILGDECEQPLRAVSAVELGEQEQPIQIETTTTAPAATTTTTLPTVTRPVDTTTTTTLPTIATTTTTTVANHAPTMAAPTACRIGSNASGGDDYQIAVDVDDVDGDSLTVAASVTFQGQSATITPTSRTISGSGTATFTLTVVQTNGDVTLTVSDGRGGSASRTISAGDDFTFDYCSTSG
jgi:hypothetical protein